MLATTAAKGDLTGRVLADVTNDTWRVKRLLTILSSRKRVNSDQGATMSVLTTVTEAETKVVDTVKGLKQPVVDYVSKGVEYAEGRVPKLTYPDTLPKPVDVIDSQYDFVVSLISAQHELVKAVVETVSPLVGAGKAHTPAAKATKATKSAA
jgi:hypothetical protein